jgi:hypothetical protein
VHERTDGAEVLIAQNDAALLEPFVARCRRDFIFQLIADGDYRRSVRRNRQTVTVRAKRTPERVQFGQYRMTCVALQLIALRKNWNRLRAFARLQKCEDDEAGDDGGIDEFIAQRSFLASAIRSDRSTHRDTCPPDP